MNKTNLVNYMLMTALSLTSFITNAQDLWQTSYFHTITTKPSLASLVTDGISSGSSAVVRVSNSKINHFEISNADINTLSNTDRLQKVLPLSSWSYLFPRAFIGYEQFIALAAEYPKLCGNMSNQASSVVNQNCRGQLAIVLTQLSSISISVDVSLDIEPWRQGLTMDDDAGCYSSKELRQSCLKMLVKMISKVLAKADDDFTNWRFNDAMRHYDLFAGFLQVPVSMKGADDKRLAKN